jgi:predicted amidohydrolase
MKVAIAQLNPVFNYKDSLQKGIEFSKKAKESGADLILFPELFSNGYDLSENALENAIKLHDNYLNEFRAAAKKFKIAIGITFLEKNSAKFYNSALLIDRTGADVLHYSKVHICEFDKESVLTPGAEFKVTELLTENEKVKIGFMICYDREFPESARVLMLKGAEIILVPNACEIEINRRSQLKSRAFENSVGIVLANYSGEVYKGNSLAISAIAFDEDGESAVMPNAKRHRTNNEQTYKTDDRKPTLRKIKRGASRHTKPTLLHHI